MDRVPKINTGKVRKKQEMSNDTYATPMAPSVEKEF